MKLAQCMSWNKDSGAIVLLVDAAKRAVGWYESMTRINNQILGESSILESRQKARERQNRSDLRQRETEESRFIERLVLRRKNDQQSQLLGKVQ